MKGAQSIEAVVLARNEEENIGDCLRSLFWADALLVVDDGSTDRTPSVAALLGAQVLGHPMRDYAQQRNAALEVATCDWVFFVDADERCTPALAGELARVVQQDKAGWWVPRDNYIFGRLTRHAGWFPDYQLRLLKRGKARYDPARPVHETVILDSGDGRLSNCLVHYNYRSLAQFRAKQRRYAELEAEALAQRGVRPKVHSLALQPWREFRRRFVTLQGYRDGGHGLLLSLLLAYYTFQTYSRLLRSGREVAL